MIGRDAYREILAEDEDTRASAEYRDWGRRVSREQAALGAYRLYRDRLARRLRRTHDRFRRKVEGNAENIGIFHVEEALVGPSSLTS